MKMLYKPIWKTINRISINFHFKQSIEWSPNYLLCAHSHLVWMQFNAHFQYALKCNFKQRFPKSCRYPIFCVVHANYAWHVRIFKPNAWLCERHRHPTRINHTCARLDLLPHIHTLGVSTDCTTGLMHAYRYNGLAHYSRIGIYNRGQSRIEVDSC